MKKNKLIILAGLCAAIIAGYLAYDNFFAVKPQKESYSVFYSLVQNKQILKAELSEKNIIYYKKGTDKPFETANPLSPSLKEFLLLNDVNLTEKTGTDEIFNRIFDVIFYVIFFGALIIAYKRVIAPNSFKAVKKTGKKFDDIAGMDELKTDLMQIMEIMKNPAYYAKKGIRMPKGILLEGEPGNGKTLFARALAGEAKVKFIATKATDFESMFMAIGPMKIKMLFAKARRLSPCIIFIDEFDGIGTRRNYSGSAIETENTRIVTALLNELDGFKPNSGILVVAATNNSKALDEALIRPGRFDAHYVIPYPELRDRIKLIELYTQQKHLDSSINIEELAKKFNGCSCATIESVLNRAAIIADHQNKAAIELNDIENAVRQNHKGN